MSKDIDAQFVQKTPQQILDDVATGFKMAFGKQERYFTVEELPEPTFPLSKATHWTHVLRAFTGTQLDYEISISGPGALAIECQCLESLGYVRRTT